MLISNFKDPIKIGRSESLIYVPITSVERPHVQASANGGRRSYFFICLLSLATPCYWMITSKQCIFMLYVLENSLLLKTSSMLTSLLIPYINCWYSISSCNHQSYRDMHCPENDRSVWRILIGSIFILCNEHLMQSVETHVRKSFRNSDQRR